MLRNIFALIILSNTLIIHSQWKTESGDNPFDGQYKSCHVIGEGGSYPFNKPKLEIIRYGDDFPSIYITDIGYTGCLRNTIRIKFNDDESVLMCDSVSSDLNNEALIINYFNNVGIEDFLKTLLVKNTMYIRVVNSCGIADYKFTLNGSSKALKYALGDFLLD